MKRAWLVRSLTILLLAPSLGLQPASAQQRGGVLKVYHWVSPASMSIHEEAGYSASVSGMGVFNNLVLYKQDVQQNSLGSIVPELASEWSWNDDRTVLTFSLRSDIKWHDGKPFTADDVKCTWDMLLGKIKPGFRLNPRKAWYHNLREVTKNGDNEVAFHLTASLYRAARGRGVTRLSMPCDAGGDAPTSGRHRSV
jgi:peptide/nickel transport system substrate-binding protein